LAAVLVTAPAGEGETQYLVLIPLQERQAVLATFKTHPEAQVVMTVAEVQAVALASTEVQAVQRPPVAM